MRSLHLPAPGTPDLGAQVAGQPAHRLVVPAHRTGGQSQFIDQPVPETDDGNLAISPEPVAGCDR
ncbi:hypothetical protein [Streptomyces sp. ISL-99]|uniref:hypothetical protein n=1 Tax=Streptomyces sp. ISL-99 TaxID=2819193 RepID=UPI0035B09634